VDSDTLWITLDLGFNTWTTRKLRLKGINAPAINTTEGKEARKYIEKQLTPCPFLIAKTYWREKYNRYLADIFYNKNETKPDLVVTTGKYLNQALMDKGLARKYTR
jgi:endonuclease YncB( thermonuclease family)